MDETLMQRTETQEALLQNADRIAADYKTDDLLDPERLELIEAALGPLIDRHLRWVPQGVSPTAGISDADYGYMPAQFTEHETDSSLRPNQEPLHFRKIAGEVLGIDPDCLHFEEEVRKIDGHGDFAEARDYQTDGFYKYLLRNGLALQEVIAMKEISETAYGVSAHTENNVPDYKLKTMGRVQYWEDRLGLSLPAHNEWYNGIWIAEEDAHSDGQDDYGRIRRLTTDLKHILSKNSQLRFGAPVDTSEIFGMSIYTTIQEFATRLAHKRNAILFGPVGHALQEEESQDETRHYDVYGGLIEAAYQDERFTEEIIMQTYQLDMGFAMPGNGGIANFKKKALSIARAKIYGVDEQKEAMQKSLRRFGMFRKNEDGSYKDPGHVSEAAQVLLDHLRAKYDTPIESKDRKGLFVLGQTITIPELRKLHKTYAAERGLPTTKNKRIKLEA